MDQDELQYLLALKSIPGVGNVGCMHLLASFGSPRAVFQADRRTLEAVPGISAKTAAAILSFGNWHAIAQEIEAARRHGATIVTCRDALYPPQLLQIYDYPVYLYVRGTLAPRDIAIAVVGSRIASTYGRFTTEKLCRELALRGINLVSGLARGIDAAAHRGALAGRGRTIAVLGCGLDVVYPPENEDLMHAIAAAGAVVTEFPFGTPPLGPHFPARNRIISGMCLGVVVVEATNKSGSLITARLALEQNREVFAVPGSIDQPGSRGTNKLIKQGAKLIEHVDDIIEEILPQLERLAPPSASPQPGPARATSPPSPYPGSTVPAAAPAPDRGAAGACPGAASLSTAARAVLAVIGSLPVDIDSIVSRTALPPQQVLSSLLTLELQGLVTPLPGKMYIRSNHV